MYFIIKESLMAILMQKEEGKVQFFFCAQKQKIKLVDTLHL